MRTHIIRTMTEMEITDTLVDAFREDLRNQIAGMYLPDDIRSTEAILGNAERSPERWKPETKREFMVFLVCRAELYVEEQEHRGAK